MKKLYLLFPFLFLYSCQEEQTQDAPYIGKWFYAKESIAYYSDTLISEEKTVIEFIDYWAFNNDEIFVYSDVQEGVTDNVGTYQMYNSDTTIIDFNRSATIGQIDTFRTFFDAMNDTASLQIIEYLPFGDTVFLNSKKIYETDIPVYSMKKIVLVKTN